MKKTISIIIPFYNEKKNIPLILNDVKQKLLNSDKIRSLGYKCIDISKITNLII